MKETSDSIIKLLYTAIQSIGCILDLSPEPQAARKNFGQRFEDFVKALLSDLGIANDAFTLEIYLVFCHVFGDLPLYYLDPPVVAKEPRFQEKIKTFDTFILYDLWNL